MWYNQNLRVEQTVLRENELLDYDPNRLVDYAKANNANCLVISGGGVVDFFPNPLDMAKPNRFLGDRDIVREVSEAAKKAGLRVIVRVDFRGVEQARYNLHPDWFAQDQNGVPKMHTYTTPHMYSPCYSSPYTSTHAVAMIDYLLSNYDIDGIWENSIGFDYGPCYCKACRANYRQATGEEIPLLPAGVDTLKALESPAFAKYRKWKESQADQHFARLRAAVKAHGDDKAYCAEIFDMYKADFGIFTGIGYENTIRNFDMVVSCLFLSSGHSPIYPYETISAGAGLVRLAQALDPQKQSLIVTGGNGNRWRYTADPKVETRLWLWELASVGTGIWNSYFIGNSADTSTDRRNAFSEKDAYTYLKDNAELMARSRPVRDVAVFYSNPTRDKLSVEWNDAKDRFGIFHRGVEQILLEHHIQFGYVTDLNLTLDKFDGIKALLMPNVAYLSDNDIAVIKEYVNNGGGLVASSATSLYDESGKKRDDFGLSDLFGVTYTGIEQNTLNDTYQLIRDFDSPVLAGVENTQTVVTSGETLLVQLTNPEYDIVTTHVPTIPNQPPENAWAPTLETDNPIIVAGQYGKGKVVYFANQIEGLAYVHGHEDYTEIYQNAIDWVTNKEYTLTTDAPRSVHVNAIKDEAGNLVLATVNTTGAGRRPVKEIIPIPKVTVNLKIPVGTGTTLWGSVAQTPNNQTVQVNDLQEFASIYLPTAATSTH